MEGQLDHGNVPRAEMPLDSIQAKRRDRWGPTNGGRKIIGERAGGGKSHVSFGKLQPKTASFRKGQKEHCRSIMVENVGNKRAQYGENDK